MLAFSETLSRQQLFNEQVFLGLRSDGVDLKRLGDEYPDQIKLETLTIAQGLISEGSALWEGSRLRLTDRGYLLCDEIAARMMI